MAIYTAITEKTDNGRVAVDLCKRLVALWR
jgi:hypothetical protein